MILLISFFPGILFPVSAVSRSHLALFCSKIFLISVIENCNGNNTLPADTSELDSSVKESPTTTNTLNNNKLEVAGRKNGKVEIFKSLSSAESWESEDDCPPLASEDSDIGDHGEFESFSGTDEEEEEEEDICTLSVTQK